MHITRHKLFNNTLIKLRIQQITLSQLTIKILLNGKPLFYLPINCDQLSFMIYRCTKETISINYYVLILSVYLTIILILNLTG